MLLEFGAYNFSSFKEGFTVNFRLDKHCPSDISKGKNYLELLAIKGANASGKTNVLKSITFLCHLACYSFKDYQPDELIQVDSFFLNDDNIDLFAIYSYENKEYKYEVSLKESGIEKETLSIDGKEVLIREKNKLDIKSKKFYDLKKIPKLRNNVSIISLAKQYELESIDIFFSLLSNILSNVSYDGFNPDRYSFDSATELYYQNEIMLDFAKDFLKKADTGIDDIFIDDSEEDPKTKKPILKPVFIYKVDGKDVGLEYEVQSNGVKALYKHISLFGAAMISGGLVVFDELDSHLHSDLFEIVISLFEDQELNVNGAQLLFTAHNDYIIDKLKKYRLVFVNKEDNESYLYRLDETGDKIRNDRSIMPQYNANMLGGKPKLGF